MPPVYAPSELAVVALGSNLGDGKTLVRQAMDRLQELSARPLLRSSLWQSDPVDCPPESPAFINAAVAMVPFSDETPESLLVKLLALEKAFGRRPKRLLNEPRPLDLDLIAFGQATRSSDLLILPHPRATQRRFVLQPLAEIIPDLVLPGQKQTVRELLATLADDHAVRQIDA